MKTNKTSQTTLPLAFSLLAGLFVTACGVNSIQTDTAVTQGLTDASTTTYTSGSTSSSSSSSGSVTVGSTGGVSPVQLRVGTTGYNPVSVTVATTSVLKVEWQPGIQDESVSGTNFEPEYSMLGVYITVGSTTQPTEMVTNGYGNTTAQTTGVMDFSSAIPSTANGNVTIVISQPNYDYYCLNYELYCAPEPWMHVLATHPWHGTLLVQTDSTSALQ